MSSITELKMEVGGLNHFAFLLKLEDLLTGKDLMLTFNKQALDYFRGYEHRFEFSTLTFEVFKKFGWFCYAGDNHLGEYLQFGEEFTQTQDMIDWINFIDSEGQFIYNKFLNYHKRLQRGRYPRRGIIFERASGERAIPIIEAIIKDKNSYEFAVNIPNDKVIDNLPQDLVLECSATVNKNGVHGVKLGNIPRNIAALLRIEASIQDLCVDAVLKKSKDLAIACLATDPNVGSFEMAEDMFNEIIQLQKKYLPKFK